MRTADLPRDLRLLRREWESRQGCSDVCQGPDGALWIRLRVCDPACRRSCADRTRADSAMALRMEGEALELLYPFRDGSSLEEWLLEARPNLGGRRDACLSLLARLVEDRPAADVAALSAAAENLRFSPDGAWLLYLPDWSRWHSGIRTAQAVRAAAEVCLEILTGALDPLQARLFPPELTLIERRRGFYTGWDQLCRDLTALPEEFPSLERTGKRAARAFQRETRRYWRPAACAAVAALVLAAALSAAGFFWKWHDARQNLFQGMTPIGTQELRQTEEGPWDDG